MSESKESPDGANFPQEPVKVAYSKTFEIDTLDGFQVLRIKDPQTGDSRDYTLVPKGMDAPENRAVIFTPVRDLSLFSVSFVGYLDALNALDKVKYIENINYIYNPAIIELYEKGSVMESGLYGQWNMEKLILNSPELMMINDFPESSNELNKLLKAGIKVLP